MMGKGVMKILLVFPVIAIFLAGCGIRPGSIDAPDGSENKPFPRQYPQPDTEPHPDSRYPY
jgi:hypothetical protein